MENKNQIIKFIIGLLVSVFVFIGTFLVVFIIHPIFHVHDKPILGIIFLYFIWSIFGVLSIGYYLKRGKSISIGVGTILLISIYTILILSH